MDIYRGIYVFIRFTLSVNLWFLLLYRNYYNYLCYQTVNTIIKTGTARRIEYTMNNTDLVNGYNPPPCFIDWPAKTDASGSPQYKWTINHCPNLVILIK